MKKSILNIAITTATAFAIAACTSDSDVAGIGGSGITPTGGVISSGTISGFGSIFVNGVEFETNSSTFSVDDNPGTESDLAIGMRVIVNGTINADGITGTATSVSFDDELQGPVSNLSAPDEDGTSRTLTILGKTVRLNSTTTNFDVTGILSGTTFDFDTIANSNNVEVSGYLDSTGILVATRVELKELSFNTSSIVELKGIITGLSGTTFNINGVSVNASSASIEDLPNGLAENAFVEVKGTCSDISCTSINASRVEGESEGFDNDDEVELEGIITRYVSDSDFDVNGFPVDASSAQKEPASLVLAEDLLVEVEGTVINGVLVATEVEQEGGETKIKATVTAVDSAAGSFELSPVSGQPAITVKIDTSTEIEDKIASFNSAALLDNLSLGTDFINVEGYDDGTGVVIAKSVVRDTPDDVILQGVVSATTGNAASGGTVTVLGVTIPFDNSTDFEDQNDNPLADADAFLAAITPGSSVIKIKDNQTAPNDIGTADEIDIEN